MKKLYRGAIVLLGLYLSSCEKESSVERGELVPVVTNLVGDTNYLDKILLNDTSYFGGVLDIDSSVFVFKYDLNKRLTTVTIKAGPLSIIPEDLYLEFFYNFNDTLPYKSYFAQEQSTYHFYYDNLGRLTKDSVNNLSGNGENFKRKLSYSGNQIFAELYNSPSVNPIEKDTFILDSRGNMVSSRFHILTTASIYELATSTISTFDNGPSPFLKTPAFKIFSFTFGTLHFEQYYNNFGKNNLLVDIHNNHPYTGAPPIFYPSDTTSVVNSYYQNGLLKNVKGHRSTWTYIYKSL